MPDAGPADDAVLALEGVRIRHDERERFTPDGAELRVGDGEVVLLLGPSGCGKSTLALAVNGLVPHMLAADLEGRVVACGVEPSSSSTGRMSEHVAMVFQDPDAQIVTATVFDEVCFALENMLLDVQEITARAEEALRAVGLDDRRDDDPSRLSGGGRQRLAIACALAMRTRLLVLDEPTANLDPVGAEDVYEALARVVADGRRSVLLIEHDVDAALAVADRVVVLDGDGRTALAGGPREVLADRADEVAALGVWLPTAVVAARRLREAGVRLDPVPLTLPELTAALDGIDELPSPATPGADSASGPGSDGGRLAGDRGVRVRGLTVARRRAEVLHDVSLDIPPGSFTAVIGENGAGKTTFLQAIAGVVPPPRGMVSVGGLDPATADVRALSARVGFVFQNPEHQFVASTVAEELAYGLRVHGRGRRAPADETAIAERVDDVLRRFGLAAERDVHPFLLSGGQKRRLSVGTALIAGAPILALDEPTFGQDRERADELMAMLDALNAGGSTVVMVTHDLQLVADHATHVVVLGGGRLLADGTAREVLSDDALLARAGLRLPPLARAVRRLERHPGWRAVLRTDDLPGGVG